MSSRAPLACWPSMGWASSSGSPGSGSSCCAGALSQRRKDSPLKGAEGTWVSPLGLAQERLTIHMHKALRSQETRRHRQERTQRGNTRPTLMSGRFVDYQVSRISGRVQPVMRSARATAS